MNLLKLQLHFLRVLKEVNQNPDARYLHLQNYEFIKAIVYCVMNTLNVNHRLTIDENSKLKKYKNWLGGLVNPKICFKSKRKRLVQNGGFIFPLLLRVL